MNFADFEPSSDEETLSCQCNEGAIEHCVLAFGMYKGKCITEVCSSKRGRKYLRWLSSLDEPPSEAILFAVNHCLNLWSKSKKR